MTEKIYILCLIIIIKSEVWTITHCLGLGHETMVCSVCLSIFLFTIVPIWTCDFIQTIITETLWIFFKESLELIDLHLHCLYHCDVIMDAWLSAFIVAKKLLFLLQWYWGSSMVRVPSSYEWAGVQWTHSFQNKGSKWNPKESIHFISFWTFGCKPSLNG